jgi:RNA polymerase sigma factor (sigma-70 family)
MPLPPFQTLLDAHGRELHRFLIATIGAGDADDCYQETWLAALRAYPQLREATNLRGWLLTIAHRKAIDHFRARSRAAVPVAEAAELSDAAGAGDARRVASGASAGALDGEIWSRVAALPDKQRAAVALRFVGDCAYAEIAGVMEISEEAARRNVHEGLKRLREEASIWTS